MVSIAFAPRRLNQVVIDLQFLLDIILVKKQQTKVNKFINRRIIR